MNFNKSGKIFMVLVVGAVLAFAVTSFAGWGRGQMGYGYPMGPGYGMHGYWAQGPRGYAGPGYRGDMNDEDLAKLDQQRQAFFEATSELRENLYQKELELRSELAKPEPDAKKAAEIQKQISSLENQLDQKRLDQQIQMRKDFPRFGYRGQGYGPGGWGMGRGMMMYGGGGYGPGSCWD